jgi:hypothetical protein
LFAHKLSLRSPGITAIYEAQSFANDHGMTTLTMQRSLSVTPFGLARLPRGIFHNWISFREKTRSDVSVRYMTVTKVIGPLMMFRETYTPPSRFVA